MNNEDKRNQVDRSGHRDEIRAMLAAKGRGHPTWTELSEEVRKRFGVAISGNMLRWYRDERMGGEVLLPPEKVRAELERRNATLDVCAERARLFKLQAARIVEMLKVDAGDPRVGSEVRVAAEILTAYRNDMLELGIVARAPKVGVGMIAVTGIQNAVEQARGRLRAASVEANSREMVVRSPEDKVQEEVLDILAKGELPPTPRGEVTHRPSAIKDWPYRDERGGSITREEWEKRKARATALEDARPADQVEEAK